VAFVTPEFVTEWRSGGGLGNYLHRMTRAVRDAGHRPEIFVLSEEAPETLDLDGMPVHRVARGDRALAVRLAYRVLGCVGPLRPYQSVISLLSGAHALARAVARAERREPFELVQAAECMATGLFVPTSPNRPLIIRCSAAADLWGQLDGDQSVARLWRTRLELAAMGRAQEVYAPSHFLAEHFRQVHGRHVKMLRPPVLQEAQIGRADPRLPPRYLLHFGQMRRRKGTDLVLDGLTRAWAQAPDLHLVLAGRWDLAQPFEAWRDALGQRGRQILWLGELNKPELYAALAGAEAAVLPPRVDNLPNTVIESLMLGVPVVGSAGASVDELVQPGVTGELVPVGDAEALGNAMAQIWLGRSEACKGFVWSMDEAMTPTGAVRRWQELAGWSS
jgi:glycosyltransferase involved in cell wall biosynthesis